MITEITVEKINELLGGDVIIMYQGSCDTLASITKEKEGLRILVDEKEDKTEEMKAKDKTEEIKTEDKTEEIKTEDKITLKDRVIALLENNKEMTDMDIARALDCAKSTVGLYRREWAIEKGVCNKKIDTGKVKALWRARWDLSEIAKEVGTTKENVIRIIKETGKED